MVKMLWLLGVAALFCCVGVSLAVPVDSDTSEANVEDDTTKWSTPSTMTSGIVDYDDDMMFEDEPEMWMSGTAGLKLVHVDIDVQADQAISGERFVAVHVPKAGAPETLRPDLVALSNMAIAFLPPTFRFGNVLSATRELVRGVRYALLVNAADADGTAVVCELTVLERPWLVDGDLQKQRELLGSNCTDSDPQRPVDAAVQAANDAQNFQFNPLFVRRGDNAGDEDFMRQLESQIVPTKPPKSTKKPTLDGPKAPRPFEATAFDEALSLIEAQIVQQGPQVEEKPEATKEADGIDEVDCSLVVERRMDAQPTESSGDSAVILVPTERSADALTVIENTVLDDIISALGVKSKAAEEHRPSIDEQTIAQNPEATIESTTDAAIVTQEPLNIVQQSALDDFLNGHVIAFEHRLSPAVVNNPETSTTSFLSHTEATIIPAVLAEPAPTQTTIESSDIVDGILEGNDAIAAEPQLNGENEPQIVGGVSSISNEEALKIVNAALAQFATVGGDKYVGKSVNIESATKQLVAGLLYKFLIRFTDDDACDLRYWSRPWMGPARASMTCNDGVKIEFNVPDVLDIKQSNRLSSVSKRSLLFDHHDDGGVRSGPSLQSHDSLELQFNKFERNYQRQYADAAERQRRQQVFATNLRRIDDLNANERGTARYGVTQFADMDAAEFARWTGLRQRPDASAQNEVRTAHATIPNVEVPRSFDWRDRGVITAVKNQGSCGSCWAFSVTGNIEGLHAIKTGKLEEYSEQELVDCDTEDHGCNGGLPDNAYKAIEQLGGLELEQDYPYSAQDGKCHFDKDKTRVHVKGAVDLPANETAMAQWLVTNGPLSIGLNANAMQFYRGGVSHPWRALCSHSKIDHGVLIVGLGQSDYPLFNKTMPYWIVKNSWGAQWGEQGYYRIYRGDNTCGVATMVSSAVLEE